MVLVGAGPLCPQEASHRVAPDTSEVTYVRGHAGARGLLGMIMYRIYVTLKNGNEATGLDLYKGSPPARGTELEVPLMRGGSVQARIGSITNTKRVGGAPVLVVAEVHANEI